MPAASATVLQNRLIARGRFRHMQALVALAELGSVGRAAQSLGMTQSGMTKLLSELESLLHTELFERHARGIRPTPACTELLAFAVQALRGIESSAAALASSRREGQGLVRVMGTTAAINGILAGSLLSFTEVHPAVQVQLQEMELDDMLLALSRGQVDLAACREPRLTPTGWTFTPVLQDEMVVVASASHPLARRRALRPQDLARERWMPGPPGAASWAVLETITNKIEARIELCEVLTRVPTVIWTMLSHSRVLAVTPASVVAPYVHAGTLNVLDLEDRYPIGDLGLLLPQSHPVPSATRLAEVLMAPRRRENSRRSPVASRR